MAEEFPVKNLFLSQPLQCAGGTGGAVTLDGISDFMARSDGGTHSVPEGCNPFELLFSFVPGGAEGQFDVTQDMMLPHGSFCGYGILPVMNGANQDVAADGQVPPGVYRFVQSSPVTPERIRAAAESLWLDSLWEEITVTYENVFVRVLKESAGWVFQIIRQTIQPA